MLLRRLFALSGTALLLSGECSHVEIRSGKVEVVATNLAGERLSEVEVEVFTLDRVLPVRADSAGMNVKYGEYLLRVKALGYASAWRRVNVYQPVARIQVELVLGHLGCQPEPADIAGRIKRDSGERGELWVKAVPVRGLGGAEARVDESGRFIISGLPQSTFLVIVMDAERIAHQQVVKTYPVGSKPTSALLIDLTGKQ